MKSAMLVLALTAISMAAHAGAPDDEFIRVAQDHWTFESARTHQRFIPFGSNLVLTSKEDLNIFGPRYDSKHYDSILASCESAGINLLKVFIPIGQVLPDPQVPGEARIAPGYLENLDDFLTLCRKHHVRAVIAFSEWGGGGCKWWHEGGEYFGRRPWKTDPGIDSIDVLKHFWTTLAKRLRDNPAVFSYTPCVEWSLPNGNLTWFPDTVGHGVLPSDLGLWYWRQWALAKYGSLDKINKVWGTSHKAISDISVVDYGYDSAKHSYADPERKVLDYSNFREWATLRYFRPQIAAIRAADPNHMVTISNHMRQWDLWEGAACYFMGFTASEEKPLVDYVTHHANFDESDLQSWGSIPGVVRGVQISARFCHAGKPMPVMIEEYSFASADQAKTAEALAAIVRGTIGHASGWTTWYLQYPASPNDADASDKTHTCAWFNADFTLTPWGKAAVKLRCDLASADLSRLKAKSVVKLDRAKELVPHGLGKLLEIAKRTPNETDPVDYTTRHERDLDIKLQGDK